MKSISIQFWIHFWSNFESIFGPILSPFLVHFWIRAWPNSEQRHPTTLALPPVACTKPIRAAAHLIYDPRAEHSTFFREKMRPTNETCYADMQATQAENRKKC